MKIVLAGSPAIAENAFEAIINNFDVVGIITQPDKKQGRGLKYQATKVAQLGEKYNIKIFKPQSIIDIYDQLKHLNYDLLLTFAYGQFLPSKILKLGTFRPLNIHGSLLPKYRGAAPIHYAILNDEQKIGITLIEMISQMDAGDIYFQASQEINSEITTGDAFEIISQLAKAHIVKWLERVFAKNVKVQKQPSNYSLAPKIVKKIAQITNTTSVYQATRKIKAFNPWPGAFILENNKRIKLFNYSLTKVLNSKKINLLDGVLYITEYQMENKNIIKI